MRLPQQQVKLLHYEVNTNGKDYVVGDLHGCFTAFVEALTVIGFDVTRDRMFSVGDLVDRGSNSIKCADLIYNDWFYSVKGNHEDMMIRSLVDENEAAYRTWLANGGMWHKHEDETVVRDLANDLNRLPLVITVGEGDQRFNVVHAELIHYDQTDNGPVRQPITDEMIDNWVFTDDEEDLMIWGRTIIANGHTKFPPPANLLWHDLNSMSLTYVGHTPVRHPVICQRQMYIDGGAVYHYMDAGMSKENALIIASPSERIVYKYTPLHKTCITIPFENIQQLS